MSSRTALVAFPILAALAASSSRAATITVSKTGAIQTIQAGVDAAGPGDTVVVLDALPAGGATYTGNVSSDGTDTAPATPEID